MKKKKRPETENKGEKTSALFVLYSEKVFQERKKLNLVSKLGFQRKSNLKIIKWQLLQAGYLTLSSSPKLQKLGKKEHSCCFQAVLKRIIKKKKVT